MADRSANYGRLPTPQQRLLLDALLLPDEEARAAGEEWLRTIDFDAIEQASMRLMPLFHDRLRELGVEHPLVPMMNGMKKLCWYLNRVLLHRAAAAVETLRGAGIEAMALKGTALTIAYYHDATLRPMSDVDLMVRRADALAAVNALCAAGWRVKEEKPRSPAYLGLMQRFGHAVNLEHPQGHSVDVHWDLLSFVRDPSDVCWQRAGHAELDGQPVRVLDAADQLLHVCAHGVAWNEVSPIRWMVDAFAVLRSSPELDWAYFTAEVHRLGLELITVQALGYLRDNFRAPVPEQVMREIGQRPATVFQRIEYRQLCQPTTGFFGFVPRKLWKLPRLLRETSVRELAMSLPDFVCWACNVDSSRQLPGVLLRRISQRMRGATA